jgi:hypothetical protein
MTARRTWHWRGWPAGQAAIQGAPVASRRRFRVRILLSAGSFRSCAARKPETVSGFEGRERVFPVAPKRILQPRRAVVLPVACRAMGR